MRRLLPSIVFILLFSISAVAQKPEIKALIDAWSLSDTNQTHVAEKTYPAESGYKDEKKFQQARDEIAAWLKKHPDTRLQIRLIMYDIMGRFYYVRPFAPGSRKDLEWAIVKAHQLGDDQLQAELYALYSKFGDHSHYLLYNLKALEMQRKIGFRHFSSSEDHFFNVSWSLYRLDDFKQTIAYGREGLTIKSTKVHIWNGRVYVFLLDIVGASYLRSGKPDSALFYYRKVIDTLNKNPRLGNIEKDLWMQIAKGNIGRALILNGKETEGLPMVQQSFAYFGSVNNANTQAIFGNVLAQVDYNRGNYRQALAKWKRSLQIGSSEILAAPEKVISLKGIAQCYKLLNMPDSAYTYDSLYHAKDLERNTQINNQKLSNQKAKIRLDDMQNDLERTSLHLEKEKLTRNLILAGILLLAIISLLFYNRQRLKARHRAEQLERDKQHAEADAALAKTQIKTFIGNIREKEELINDLKQALTTNQAADTEQNQVMFDNLQNHILLTDSEWYKFKDAFQRAYPLFLPQLKELIPQINPAEERLASLLSLQLNNPQIARMLGISADSVSRSKRRLKKRIDLPESENLEDFLYKLAVVKYS